MASLEEGRGGAGETAGGRGGWGGRGRGGDDSDDEGAAAPSSGARGGFPEGYSGTNGYPNGYSNPYMGSSQPHNGYDSSLQGSPSKGRAGLGGGAGVCHHRSWALEQVQQAAVRLGGMSGWLPGKDFWQPQQAWRKGPHLKRAKSRLLSDA